MPPAAKALSGSGLYDALTHAYVAVTAECGALLRAHELTVPKYQVLRILKAHGGALPAGLIGAEMSFPSSDLTRLLDGLERVQLVRRERGREDRRVVMVQLSAAASKLLRTVDVAMEKCYTAQFKSLSKADQETLGRLLLRLAE